MKNRVNIIVSFADITFTIIFFIVLSISNSQEEKVIKKEEIGKTITIFQNTIYFEDKAIELKILDKLLSNYKNNTITIKSDNISNFDTLYKVIQIIKKHNINNMVFIYEDN